MVSFRATARRFVAMKTANFMASIMLAGSADPVPAMSNAVPWSGDVRTTGNPSDTFTPLPAASIFSGMSPWSWYMATTAS